MHDSYTCGGAMYMHGSVARQINSAHDQCTYILDFGMGGGGGAGEVLPSHNAKFYMYNVCCSSSSLSSMVMHVGYVFCAFIVHC